MPTGDQLWMAFALLVGAGWMAMAAFGAREFLGLALDRSRHEEYPMNDRTSTSTDLGDPDEHWVLANGHGVVLDLHGQLSMRTTTTEPRFTGSVLRFAATKSETVAVTVTIEAVRNEGDRTWWNVWMPTETIRAAVDRLREALR